jgi:hypothetical protein
MAGDVLVLKRFANATERAELPGRNRRVEGRIRRDHHHHGFAIEFQNLFQRAQPADARHRNVQQNCVIRPIADSRQALFARLRQVHTIAVLRQQALQHVAHHFFVVHNQNVSFFRHTRIVMSHNPACQVHGTSRHQSRKILRPPFSATCDRAFVATLLNRANHVDFYPMVRICILRICILTILTFRQIISTPDRKSVNSFISLISSRSFLFLYFRKISRSCPGK